jgi:hypothetical protein
MAATTGPWEWLSALGPGELLPVIIMGMFALILAITVICGTICQIHKNRLADSLKRELLDRGMTADEIATVVRAKPGRSGGCGSNTI